MDAHNTAAVSVRFAIALSLALEFVFVLVPALNAFAIFAEFVVVAIKVVLALG